MHGTEQMELEVARQHHADRIREASLERALAASTTRPEYPTGFGTTNAIGIVTAGVRSLFRWLTAPRQQPAGATR